MQGDTAKTTVSTTVEHFRETARGAQVYNGKSETSGEAMSRYCQHCDQEVEPTTEYSTALLVVLLLFGIGPGLLYYLYAKLIKSSRCPLCNGTSWGRPDDDEDDEADE